MVPWEGTETQFRYKALKPLKLKGKSEKVPAYRFLVDGGQITRRRVRRIEMVGRDREKKQIMDAIDAGARIPCEFAFGAPIGFGPSEGWPTTSKPVPRGTTR